MEQNGKSYIIKIDGSYIYIIDALTNEIIQKFEVIDKYLWKNEYKNETNPVVAFN